MYIKWQEELVHRIMNKWYFGYIEKKIGGMFSCNFILALSFMRMFFVSKFNSSN